MNKQYTIFQISNVLKRFIKEEQVKLGRWNLKHCDSSKLNIFYNNRDHCGDKICKTPLKYKPEIYEKHLKANR